MVGWDLFIKHICCQESIKKGTDWTKKKRKDKKVEEIDYSQMIKPLRRAKKSKKIEILRDKKIDRRLEVGKTELNIDRNTRESVDYRRRSRKE